jgi:hypothetical protein
MSAWKKIALVAAGCGVAVFAYASKMTKMKARLIVIPNVSVFKVGLTGLVLRANVLIKNYSSGKCSIKFPFITLTYKDTLLGSSNVVNKDIPIEAYGQTLIEQIDIDVPLASVFSVVSALIDAIQNKKSVSITVKTTTVIDLGLQKMDYEDTQTIPLKN